MSEVLVMCSECRRQPANDRLEGWTSIAWSEWVQPCADNPTGTINRKRYYCPVCGTARKKERVR